MRKKLTRRKLTLSEKIGIKEVIGNFKLNNESEFISVACSMEITFYLLLSCVALTREHGGVSKQTQTSAEGALCLWHNKDAPVEYLCGRGVVVT